MIFNIVLRLRLPLPAGRGSGLIHSAELLSQHEREKTYGGKTIMRTFLSMLALSAAVTGCGGQYILTTPDHAGPAGGETTIVVRLQRSEVYKIAPPVTEALLRFRTGDDEMRGAYTDKLGYAGTTVAIPATPGLYTVMVSLQDTEGDEASESVRVYAWDPARPIVAVDMDSLPLAGRAGAKDAIAALAGIAQRANVLYLTRRSVARHGQGHGQLRVSGYPDGPILLWRRQRWRIVRTSRFKVRVIVDKRLVSQLAELRKVFGGLATGICTSSLAARAFAQAGMKSVVIGRAEVSSPNVTRHQTWADLAMVGID